MYSIYTRTISGSFFVEIYIAGRAGREDERCAQEEHEGEEELLRRGEVEETSISWVPYVTYIPRGKRPDRRMSRFLKGESIIGPTLACRKGLSVQHTLYIAHGQL